MGGWEDGMDGEECSGTFGIRVWSDIAGQVVSEFGSFTASVHLRHFMAAPLCYVIYIGVM